MVIDVVCPGLHEMKLTKKDLKCLVEDCCGVSSGEKESNRPGMSLLVFYNHDPDRPTHSIPFVDAVQANDLLTIFVHKPPNVLRDKDKKEGFLLSCDLEYGLATLIVELVCNLLSCRSHIPTGLH